MKSLVLALGVVLSALFTTPAFAAGGSAPAACSDGTAPEGWLRDGGFCEIAARGAETTSRQADSDLEPDS